MFKKYDATFDFLDLHWKGHDNVDEWPYITGVLWILIILKARILTNCTFLDQLQEESCQILDKSTEAINGGSARKTAWKCS